MRPWTNTRRKTPQTSFQGESSYSTRHTISLSEALRAIEQSSKSVTALAIGTRFESETPNTWQVVVQHNKGAKYE